MVSNLNYKSECVFFVSPISCYYVPLLYGSVSQGLGTPKFMNLIG